MDQFHQWPRIVGEQHRIALGNDVVAVVPWLETGKARSCVAFIGSFGQVQIFPEPPESETRDKLAVELATLPGRPHEAAMNWVTFARFAASTWPVQFTVDKGRTRFILPEEIRLLGITPSIDSTAVLFLTGAILEVWKADDWVAHIRSTRAALSNIVRLTLNELSAR
jgi:hypothetical protein